MSYASLQSSVVFFFDFGSMPEPANTMLKSNKELVKPKPPKQKPNTPVHVTFSRKRTEKAARSRANKITEAEQHEEAIALKFLRHLSPQAVRLIMLSWGSIRQARGAPPKALNLSDMREGLNS